MTHPVALLAETAWLRAHLAARRTDRVASLALVCSSVHFGATQPWQERADLVRLKGTAPLLDTSPRRWFATAAFAGTSFGRRLLDNLADAESFGYAACCDALANYGLRPTSRRSAPPPSSSVARSTRPPRWNRRGSSPRASRTPS
ncbi:hypothetical protein ACWCO9_14350 [Streptomyces sp. NPDC001937]